MLCTVTGTGLGHRGLAGGTGTGRGWTAPPRAASLSPEEDAVPARPGEARGGCSPSCAHDQALRSPAPSPPWLCPPASQTTARSAVLAPESCGQHLGTRGGRAMVLEQGQTEEGGGDTGTTTRVLPGAPGGLRTLSPLTRQAWCPSRTCSGTVPAGGGSGARWQWWQRVTGQDSSGQCPRPAPRRRMTSFLLPGCAPEPACPSPRF